MRVHMLGDDLETGSKPVYSLEQFEADVQNFKPRTFDTYILPGFLMIYAFKSKQMKKTARRILFTSGIYMMYRNYSEYKNAIIKMQQALAVAKGETNGKEI